jgi:4-deoxy-L-threo-5-hexosulose-uronate ketol-isomerase
MQSRYTADFSSFQRMTTRELRQSYLVETLFQPGQLQTVYVDIDRAIIGSAVPTTASLALASSKELASDFFAQRRELGVINVGAAGTITVDGKAYAMANRDCLYIGRGSRVIEFASANAADPAKFYILSYPAHADYPTTHATYRDATPVKLGSQQTANQRTIYKFIYPAGIKSCQLVMGFTELVEGSVWNSMPAHTHERRSEIYCYFDLPAEQTIFHLMGKADETRHLAVKNLQPVISPSWSIHCGVGTSNYTFMGNGRRESGF